MKLLKVYDDKDEAEIAESLISGDKRLASERDDTQVIYNLFGQASWSNFYKLGMFNLIELQKLLELKKSAVHYDTEKHTQIITLLENSARIYNLEIPEHWK